MLKLKPSARLKGLTGFMHGLALMACLVNALPITVKGMLFIIISIQLWYVVKRVKCEQPTIKYTESLGWEVSVSNNVEAVRILPSTVITTVVIFLHLEVRNASVGCARQNLITFKGMHTFGGTSKKTLLILSDALSEDDYRRLIVKLKTSTTK